MGQLGSENGKGQVCSGEAPGGGSRHRTRSRTSCDGEGRIRRSLAGPELETGQKNGTER